MSDKILNLNEREEKLVAPKDFPTVSIHKLSGMQIEKAKEIVHPFIYEGSSMEIYAQSGVGKTWFSLELCLSIASGRSFLDKYEVINPRPVFYIDGEMKLEMMQDRINNIVMRHGASFRIPEGYFELSNPYIHEDKVIPKLNHPETIRSIKEKVKEISERTGQPVFLVIDNLSCLTDMKENEGDDYIPMLDLYTNLKTQNHSICHIHHANKSGNGSRGTSRRHDALDTIIKLARPSDYEEHQGANFNVHFEKHRNFAGEYALPFNAKIDPDDNYVNWKITEFSEAIEGQILTEWVVNSPNITVDKVSTKLDIPSSTVHRKLQKMKNDGRYEKEMKERWGEEWQKHCKFNAKGK
jgi:RecA-family ATPase